MRRSLLTPGKKETKRLAGLRKLIVEKLALGYIFASYRAPGETPSDPLRFKLVSRTSHDPPKGEPREIPVDYEAGMAFIEWRDVAPATMWGRGNKIGWADMGLPPGADYWFFIQ